MAKVKLLVDTDVIIDFLKGVKPARDIFRSTDIDIYCSVLSKKELLSKVLKSIDGLARFMSEDARKRNELPRSRASRNSFD